eukprot:2264811-Prymnesium_polylepis.1
MQAREAAEEHRESGIEAGRVEKGRDTSAGRVKIMRRVKVDVGRVLLLSRLECNVRDVCPGAQSTPSQTQSQARGASRRVRAVLATLTAGTEDVERKAHRRHLKLHGALGLVERDDLIVKAAERPGTLADCPRTPL